MDIGTAKPDAAARAAVPHHLLDLVDPDASFTVADWVDRARQLVPEIWARGRLPVVVGGTGLYVSALVDGYRLAAQPPSAELRRELAAEMEQVGLAALAERLASWTRQPRPASTCATRGACCAPWNASSWPAALDGPVAEPWPGGLAMIGIERPRPVLRASARAAAMFAGGLLDEAPPARRGLRSRPAAAERPWYREAFHVLAGEWNVDRAVADGPPHPSVRQAPDDLVRARSAHRVAPAADRPAANLAEQAADLVHRLTA